MIKKRLFTPGPTPVPEEISLAMAHPMIHHRHDEFITIFSNAQKNLNYLFQTSSNVLVLTSSGTGTLEAIVTNFTNNNDVLVVINGKFGERWKDINELNGNRVYTISPNIGDAASSDEIISVLKKNKNITHLFITHSETSTGTFNAIEELSKSIKNEFPEILIGVDGITSIGSHKFCFDEWNLDFACTGSQKGLMLPPGLAFVAVSEKGWASYNKKSTYYFDLKKSKIAQEKGQTPYTPSVSLIVGLDKALRMIREEGIENVWNRHQRLADATRSAVKKLGLTLFSSSPSNALTAVNTLESIPSSKIISLMKSECGMTIANGQDQYKDKIFRISHLGYYDDFDIISVISALEKVLITLGHSFELGSGVAESMKSLWNK